MFQKKISELRDSNKFEKLQIPIRRIFIIWPLVHPILELLRNSSSDVVSSKPRDPSRFDFHDFKHHNLYFPWYNYVKRSKPMALCLLSSCNVYLSNPRCYWWQVGKKDGIVLPPGVAFRSWMWCYSCCNDCLCCHANYENGRKASFFRFCNCYY